MLDKKERNMLFPDHSVNFSSAGLGASHLQNTDFTPSSYFFNMNILEEASTKRKFLNLDGKNHPGVSSLLTGNNQFYDKDDFSIGQQAEYDKINKVLFSNQRQPYFQQKESSFLPEIYKEEVSRLRDIDHIGSFRQSEPSGFRSECGRDLLETFLHAQDKQQHGMVIPRLPLVLESSSYAEASLGKEKLKNTENIYLGKQDETAVEPNNRSLVERNSYANASLSSERLVGIGDVFSSNVDEQNKTTSRRVSPVISEKIWDGSLKLNTSTTVSAVAFFKSGEKVQDLNWPAHIEIKGKVRLQAFEKFIQELPRSRNRALMVISLCWKVGSCRTDLAGMMEIAKGYRETEKVGFAQIPPGIDIYVCPRSDIIITILAKYGFFKGMAAVEEDQDSLIGCVVWRRGQSSTAKDTLGKKTLIEEQPLNSTGFSIQGMNSPAMEARECEKKQDMPSEIELKAGSEAATSPSVTDARSIIIDNKASLSSSNSNSSGFHCSAVQTISEKPSLNFLQENMKPADIIPLAQNSGADEAVLVSASSTQFVSPSKTDPVFMLRSSFSGSVSQSLGNFGSGPGPGPRPLIPVDSSNFQFQPQLAEKANNSSATINDSNCAGMNLAPSLQVTQPSLPGPPPFPLELLHRLIQSKENAPKAIINGGMLQDEIHIMHQIQATRDSSGGGRKEEEDDDLPEFDFNSACGEPEAPISRFHGFPNATPLNEKPSFAAPWIAGDPTPLASRTTKSFEALQHRQKPPTLPNNLSNSNEGLSLVAENYAKKTPSTEGCYQLTIQPSCFKETKDLGNNPSHGFAFERKSLWDDDDDMPEWCPPDLELPKQPLSGPDTTAPLSFHPCESHELPQRSKPGLLGPCPTTEAPKGGTARTRPTGEFAQISDLSKPPLGSRRRDPFRTHAGKFNRRPGPYDGRRHQS